MNKSTKNILATLFLIWDALGIAFNMIESFQKSVIIKRVFEPIPFDKFNYEFIYGILFFVGLFFIIKINIDFFESKKAKKKRLEEDEDNRRKQANVPLRHALEYIESISVFSEGLPQGKDRDLCADALMQAALLGKVVFYGLSMETLCIEKIEKEAYEDKEGYYPCIEDMAFLVIHKEEGRNSSDPTRLYVALCTIMHELEEAFPRRTQRSMSGH